MNLENPLIVQGDSTLLLEVNNPLFKETRTAITAFAHLEKSPEFIHTYLITPLSLWNAASLGWNPKKVIDNLERFSKYALPQNILQDIHELMGRFGKLVLKIVNEKLLLFSEDIEFISHLSKHPKVNSLLRNQYDKNSIEIPYENRGLLKQILITLGYPVHDLAGYVDGEPFNIALRDMCLDGTKLKELGWKPPYKFEDSLKKTIDWELNNN